MSRGSGLDPAAEQHPAVRLWHQHRQVAPYPPGVIPVPVPIPGISFFPGGYGLWREDTSKPLPPWPMGGVMILGHDFHSETGYHQSMARGREAATQPTWRNLVSLLEVARIDPVECFFTNAYMGLREGSATTGRFPGSTDASFVERCREFLGQQIAAQQPRLILTLGKWVPALLAPLAPSLRCWVGQTTFKELDGAGPVQREVSFGDVAGVTVVALTHPSLRHAAVRYRRFQGLAGDAAERAMLRRALESS